MTRLRRSAGFAAGVVVAMAALLAGGELFLRCFPPQDFRPYLGDQSVLSGPYLPDEQIGVRYRDWSALERDYRVRLEEMKSAFESPRVWAMFGSSFVHMHGMLADTTRDQIPDRPVFNLARNEWVFVRVAQVEMLLARGMRPERVFFVLLPLDASIFAKHALDQIHVTPQGGVAYEPRRPSYLAPVLDSSRLAMLAWVRTGRHEAIPHFRPGSMTDRTHPQILADMRRVLERLGEVTRHHSIPATVVLVPNFEQITRGARFAYQDDLAGVCRECGLDVCDVRTVFVNANDKPSLFIPDKHFSARGNRILLDAILTHLDQSQTPARVTRRGEP